MAPPLSDAEAARLFARQDRIDDQVQRMDRGDAAHDVLLALHGRQIEDLGVEMRRGFDDVRRDVAAGMGEVRTAVADVREHQQKDKSPWWHDVKLWGIIAVALLGGGNAAVSATSAAKEPVPIVAPALATPPVEPLTQRVVDLLEQMARDRSAPDADPTPTPVPPTGQPQRQPGRRTGAGQPPP